jgi:hypothetical protein
LVIAHRELRELEIELLKVMNPTGQQTFLDVATLSNIDVNQFYGIERFEFPTRIAEVALWMMDHIINSKLSLAFGDYYARIPLKASPHIHNADALEIDWNIVISAKQCSYILGNPPFAGAKYQSVFQREQVRRIARLGGSGGTLDFVTAWFLKAGEYVQHGTAWIGFVATNSITQGEQVAQLWPLLFERCRLEIAFAHRTFAWGSDARGVAHVHVVIIGLARRDDEPKDKRLFSYDDINGDPVVSLHSALSPYLFDASALADRHLVVQERSKPLSDVPRLVSGTQPIDDGNYIFDEAERAAFLAAERAARLLHPYVGSVEYINGLPRWILCLKGASPAVLRKLPLVIERMQKVKAFRTKSKRTSTLTIADYPDKYNAEVIPDRAFLCIPEVSSERREYVPIGWLTPPTIPSNLVRVLVDADPWHFGILTSRMHMSWLRYIGGRLKSDYRYSIGIVYNTFPWPQATDRQQDHVRQLAQDVLNARALFPNVTLADLYDITVMKPELRRAHRALDASVDSLYRSTRFHGDRERVEHLFTMYERLLSPLIAAPKQRRTRGRR